MFHERKEPTAIVALLGCRKGISTHSSFFVPWSRGKMAKIAVLVALVVWWAEQNSSVEGYFWKIFLGSWNISFKPMNYELWTEESRTIVRVRVDRGSIPLYAAVEESRTIEQDKKQVNKSITSQQVNRIPSPHASYTPLSLLEFSQLRVKTSFCENLSFTCGIILGIFSVLYWKPVYESFKCTVQ